MLMEKKNEFLIALDKPFNFEGKEYKEIDLSGLENLTTEDLCDVQQAYTAFAPARSAVMSIPEVDVEYACLLAAKVAKQPIEFFKKLPAKDGRKIKMAIMEYFLKDGE